MVGESDGSQTTPTPSSPTLDTEKANPTISASPPAAATAAAADDGSTAVRSVLGRWRREDRLARGTFVLRAAVLLLSLLTVIVLGTNNHGDWKNSFLYREYTYLLAISVITSLYAITQAYRQARRFKTGSDFVPRKYAGIVDFAGDQAVAYLLISAVSAAIPITNNMRVGADNIFTDSSAASISLGFFAFLACALCALVSGFKLSKETYI